MKKFLFVACMTASAVSFAGTEAKFAWSAGDLTSAEGVTSTYERAEQFAKRFCRSHLSGSARELSRSSSCRVQVTKEIVAGVNDARLTAYAETGVVDARLLAQK